MSLARFQVRPEPTREEHLYTKNARLANKHSTRLVRVAKDKQSGLSRTFANSGRKKFIFLTPGGSWSGDEPQIYIRGCKISSQPNPSVCLLGTNIERKDKNGKERFLKIPRQAREGEVLKDGGMDWRTDKWAERRTDWHDECVGMFQLKNGRTVVLKLLPIPAIIAPLSLYEHII